MTGTEKSQNIAYRFDPDVFESYKSLGDCFKQSSTNLNLENMAIGQLVSVLRTHFGKLIIKKSESDIKKKILEKFGLRTILKLFKNVNHDTNFEKKNFGKFLNEYENVIG